MVELPVLAPTQRFSPVAALSEPCTGFLFLSTFLIIVSFINMNKDQKILNIFTRGGTFVDFIKITNLIQNLGKSFDSHYHFVSSRLQ